MTRRITDAAHLERLRTELQAARDPERKAVAVCAGTGCVAYGSRKLTAAFREAVAARKLDVEVRATGCHGFCERGPLVVVFPAHIFYQRVQPKDVDEILDRTVAKGEVLERLLYVDPSTGQKHVHEEEVPFYAHQHRLILGFNGRIDPESLDDYVANGGYRALARTLTSMLPEQVIEAVTKAGLRGRGGAGFPTGRKWALCRQALGNPKYVVCNADEGDPGAFMDRSVLEGNPHGVVEGMILGAYAVGAREGYVYVRNEYPLAVERLSLAVTAARDAGLLGSNILGRDFSFDIHITRGAGAFVCGEETALLASIEGNPGQPRFRPPYPAQSGLWGKPTVINNVETWVNVPLILDRGVDWYAGIGTAGSKGTKIFSLVGKVNNTGLVEVPMGATLRHIVYGIGGGIQGGRAFKAVQTGGPSGGCLPAEQLDLQIDFESLTAAGSMMGSGGMIVMDDRTCMVDVARYFIDFLIEESCGKCVPCREGLTQMGHLLHAITEGRATDDTLAELEALAPVVQDASLCALGQTAPNPVLSTIKYFRDEYLAHIRDHRCPAGVCKALITYSINDKCTGCMVCARQCPEHAITGERKKLHVIDTAKCTRCGICQSVCKFDAVDVR
ncbi:MAG: NADH-quinone oxidoreductase subunit NuoF [Deltaproteobacteria bacterium]|nr:NADH-quinone oxidoreductase subunit NuoF [Deltaproteobacteria bacterium]